jgi:hypothetical protein
MRINKNGNCDTYRIDREAVEVNWNNKTLILDGSNMLHLLIFNFRVNLLNRQEYIYICLFVFVCIYIRMYVHKRTYVCMVRIYVYIYLRMYLYMYIHMYVYMHIGMYSCMYICMCMYVCMYVCICR